MLTKIFWVAIVGYLIGSIPFSYIIPRFLKGVDIRKVGNRKVGGSNVARTIGIKYGVISGLLDALKGVSAIVIFKLLGEPSQVQAVAGVFAVVGHNWPVFLKFYGGRGIAVTLGVLLLMMPKLTLVGLIVVGILTILKEHALGVLLGLITVTLISYIFPSWVEGWMKWFTTAILLIVVFKRVSPLPQDVRSGKPLHRAFVNRFLFDREPVVIE